MQSGSTMRPLCVVLRLVGVLALRSPDHQAFDRGDNGDNGDRAAERGSIYQGSDIDENMLRGWPNFENTWLGPDADEIMKGPDADEGRFQFYHEPTMPCPPPSLLRDDENFDSGAYSTPALIQVHSCLLLLFGLTLLAVAVTNALGLVTSTAWLFPLSTLLFAWRLCTLESNIMMADASVLQLAMLTTATSPLRRAVVVLLLLLVCVSWTRAGRAVHAALVGAYMLMTGMHLECTSVHWLLVQLCCASDATDLVEVCLACVHVMCGVQKLRLSFWQEFPGFVRSELARVTGIELPEVMGKLAARSVPPIELAGGMLVLAATFGASHASSRSSRARRFGQVLGNVLLLGYHTAAATMLYGQADAGSQHETLEQYAGLHPHPA